MFNRKNLLAQAKEQFAGDSNVLDAVEYILTKYQSTYWTVMKREHYGIHTLQDQAELSDSTITRLITHFKENEVNNSKYGIFINVKTMRDQDAGVKQRRVYFIHFNPYKEGKWNELGSFNGNTRNTKKITYNLSAVNYLSKHKKGRKLKESIIKFLAGNKSGSSKTPTPSKKTPKSSKRSSRRQGSKSTKTSRPRSNSSSGRKRKNASKRRALSLPPAIDNDDHDKFNEIFTTLCGNLHENISQA